MVGIEETRTDENACRQLEPFGTRKSAVGASAGKGVPTTGKRLKRSLDDREASEGAEGEGEGEGEGDDHVDVDADVKVNMETGKADGEEEDEDEDDEDEEAIAKRVRTSKKTGKRGPAGRVPLKTKADDAAAGAGAKKAGKQAAATAREPVSIVRKADGDAIVDDLGNVLDKLPPTGSAEEEEEEEDGDAEEPMEVDGTEEAPSPGAKGEDAEVKDEGKLVDGLTHGVTIDMDDAERLVESLGANGLDGVDDWADIEFVSPPLDHSHSRSYPPYRKNSRPSLPRSSTKRATSSCPSSPRPNLRQQARSS